MKSVDLRMQPFGKWTVIQKGHLDPVHGQFWVCWCACNPAVTVELVQEALVEEWTRSCGCDYVNSRGERRPRVNWVGRQVGERLVVRFETGRKQPGYIVRCSCPEGRETFLQAGAVSKRNYRQCKRCAQRKLLRSRRYNQLFVEGVVGQTGDRELTYRCQFADGTIHEVRGSAIRSGRIKGVGMHPHQGRVAQNEERLVGFLASGLSNSEIASDLGVSETCVANYLTRHSYLAVLAASLPPDEALLGEGQASGRRRHSHYGHVVNNEERVRGYLAAGLSQAQIARALGVGDASVSLFLKRRPDLKALVSSHQPHWGRVVNNEDFIRDSLTAGLSQRQIARALGVGDTAVSLYLQRNSHLKASMAPIRDEGAA